MKFDKNALTAACFEVACAIRWKDDPVDEVIVKASVELYFYLARRVKNAHSGMRRTSQDRSIQSSRSTSLASFQIVLMGLRSALMEFADNNPIADLDSKIVHPVNNPEYLEQ
jgi:hypothetical protein